MQMTKSGAVKDVPDELAEFMGARGWKPADVAPPAATPETPAGDHFFDFYTVEVVEPEDEDAVDPDAVDDSTIEPAEEQS